MIYLVSEVIKYLFWLVFNTYNVMICARLVALFRLHHKVSKCKPYSLLVCYFIWTLTYTICSLIFRTGVYKIATDDQFRCGTLERSAHFIS